MNSALWLPWLPEAELRGLSVFLSDNHLVRFAIVKLCSRTDRGSTAKGSIAGQPNPTTIQCLTVAGGVQEPVSVHHSSKKPYKTSQTLC